MLRFGIVSAFVLALLVACTAPSTNADQPIASDRDPIVVPSDVPSNAAPPDADPADDELAGSSWSLSEIRQGDQSSSALPGGSIKFEENRASGRTSCNSYGSDYTKSGNSISFTAPIQTEMACDPPLMEQERIFTTLLVESESYRIEDDQLILSGPNGELVFDRS
jgi:Heat shock protein